LPARRWLEYYAQHFRTVEVNNTFYRLPSRDAVANWVTQTPPDFVFAVKASRYLTHIKRLTTVEQGWKLFRERIEPLIDAGKLGPVLWQLPANFHCDLARLESALEQLPPGRHAFEFRHPSWFKDGVYAALRRRNAALVIAHHPERPFQTYELTADWTFVRFHYGARGRGGNYSKTELETWRGRIAQWRRSVDLYAYFNNDWRTYAVRNALELKRGLD
jgi:uncharacterized protein YecE (DUF72 family)